MTCGSDSEDFCINCYDKGGEVKLGEGGCWCESGKYYMNVWSGNCNPALRMCDVLRGNWNLDPGEECDDGDLESDDGCSFFCKLEDEYCSDGIINNRKKCDGNELGGETCDSLNFLDGQLGCKDSCYHDTTQCGPKKHAYVIFRATLINSETINLSDAPDERKLRWQARFYNSTSDKKYAYIPMAGIFRTKDQYGNVVNPPKLVWGPKEHKNSDPNRSYFVVPENNSEIKNLPDIAIPDKQNLIGEYRALIRMKHKFWQNGSFIEEVLYEEDSFDFEITP